MNQVNDAILIGEAIQRLYADAGLAISDRIAPVPLDRLIRTNRNLEHIEEQALTPAIAGKFLATAGGHWSELLKDNTPLDGLLVVRASEGYVSEGYIFVRADVNNPVPRRRFTAAHELGHYCLHFLPSLGSRREPDTSFVQADNKETIQEREGSQDVKALPLPVMERQANRFAAELLMPESVCRSASELYGGYFGRAPGILEHHLARDLLVSRGAMDLRLRSLGLKT